MRADPLGDELARGDAAFARRAEGHRGDRARPEPIDRAIRAYETALSAAPESLEARWKLLRALHFRGWFASEERDEQRTVLDRARRLSEESLTLLAGRTGGEEPLEGLAPERLRETLARARILTPPVARLYFWSAIDWGAWARAFGLLRAVRRGVANRLRDYAHVTLALEPEYESGGADRLLASLHAELPRIPWLSGWVDRDQALPHAERALAIDPEHAGNRLLLALTLLDLHPVRRDEALSILREVGTLAPRPEALVEDLAIRRAARERLEREGAALPPDGPGAQ